MDHEKLKEAKRLYQTANSSQKYVLESLFPELKESEDERIRKALIKLLRNLFNNYSYFIKDPFYTECINWLEKQGEQKQDPCEHCKDKCLNCHNFPCIEKRTFEQGKSALEAIKKEKVDNANKVGPKFKVGEWIVDNCGNVWQIVEVLSNFYRLKDINEFESLLKIKWVDETFHLWSVKDAKPGDVLFKDFFGGMTFIFDGINPERAILYSFIISNDGGMVVHYNIGKPNTGIGYVEEKKNIIHPATKKQRELLFSKMKEAGYEWDAENKELKEIVNKEQIKKNLQDNSFRRMFEKKELKKIEFNPDELIEESYQQQADDLIDMVEEKPSWNEEDDSHIRGILSELQIARSKAIVEQYKDSISSDIDWLKSLKERYIWKPSDEQIEAIRLARSFVTDDFGDNPTLSEILIELEKQLKKLKGE